MGGWGDEGGWGDGGDNEGWCGGGIMRVWGVWGNNEGWCGGDNEGWCGGDNEGWGKRHILSCVHSHQNSTGQHQRLSVV